jgi:hypothetical protein
MHKHRGMVLLLALLVLLGMHYMPGSGLILYPLMLFDTMVHEMGHGLTALLLGGKLDKLELFTDGSGLAHCAVRYPWQEALVAAGGLLGPPFMAAFAFAAARRPRAARIWVLGMGAFLLGCLIGFVRGGMAWPFLLLISLGLLAIGIRGRTQWVQVTTLVLGLELAVLTYSRSDYLFVGSATINGATQVSDVGAIAAALVLPYWFWGGVIGLFSALMIGWEARSYLRSTRIPK